MDGVLPGSTPDPETVLNPKEESYPCTSRGVSKGAPKAPVSEVSGPGDSVLCLGPHPSRGGSRSVPVSSGRESVMSRVEDGGKVLPVKKVQPSGADPTRDSVLAESRTTDV